MSFPTAVWGALYFVMILWMAFIVMVGWAESRNHLFPGGQFISLRRLTNTVFHFFPFSRVPDLCIVFCYGSGSADPYHWITRI
jgi:hypothetical protein